MKLFSGRAPFRRNKKFNPRRTLSFPLLLSDIDECVERFNNQPCPDLAHCIDLEGSFRCGCREGYAGNGTVCYGENLMFLINCEFIL